MPAHIGPAPVAGGGLEPDVLVELVGGEIFSRNGVLEIAIPWRPVATSTDDGTVDEEFSKAIISVRGIDLVSAVKIEAVSWCKSK